MIEQHCSILILNRETMSKRNVVYFTLISKTLINFWINSIVSFFKALIFTFRVNINNDSWSLEFINLNCDTQFIVFVFCSDFSVDRDKYFVIITFSVISICSIWHIDCDDVSLNELKIAASYASSTWKCSRTR